MKKQFSRSKFIVEKTHWINSGSRKYFSEYSKAEQWKKKFDNFKDDNKRSNFDIKKQQFFNKSFSKSKNSNEHFSIKFKQNFSVKNNRRWFDKKSPNLFKVFNSKYLVGRGVFDQSNRWDRTSSKSFFDKLWKQRKFNNTLKSKTSVNDTSNFNKFSLSRTKYSANLRSNHKIRVNFTRKFNRNVNNHRGGKFINFKKNNKFFNSSKSYNGLKFPSSIKFSKKFVHRRGVSNGRWLRQYQYGKKPRFLKGWRTCKKPFWKRKSFKFIKLYNLIFLNLFKAYSIRRLKMRKMRRKKIIGFDKRGRKRKKRFIGKRFWHEYFRRNKVKFWFRNKIALRFAWMTRYSCWTHKQTAKFVWRIRRRNPALLRFWQEYEFTLDRYILWWQIAPRLTQNNLRFSRQIIINGYVYVNFVRVVSPAYRIQLGDCVFVLKQFYGGFHRTYITTKLLNPFKSLYRRGYRLRCITKFQPKYLFKRKFMFFLKRYKMLKNLSHWSKVYFLYFRYFVEKSYKYRIFVNLHSMSWFTLIFSTIGKSYYPITYYFINSFVNRRYG